MALCEKCGSSGHDMKNMKVDDDNKTFVGPCCVKIDPEKLFDQTEVQYGVEFSSHVGLKAYATYGGFTVEFKKTKEELNKWLGQKKSTPQEVTEEQAPQEPEVTTSAIPMPPRTSMPN